MRMMTSMPSAETSGDTSGPSQSLSEGVRPSASPEEREIYFWEDAEEMKTVVEALRYHEEPNSPINSLITSLHHPVLSSGGSDFYPLWEHVIMEEETREEMKEDMEEMKEVVEEAREDTEEMKEDMEEMKEVVEEMKEVVEEAREETGQGQSEH